MKYYKTPNEIRAIEEGQESLIQDDWVPMTDEELQMELNPPLTLEQAKAKSKIILSQKFDEAIAIVTVGVNPNEVQSWTIQEKEARNPDLPTPMIDALALSRGIDRLELIGRIIAKADAYAEYVGTQLGKLQKLEDQLAATTTISEVETIQW